MSDDGEVVAVRIGDWKLTLAEQRAFTMRVVGGAVRQTAPSAHLQSSARSVRTGEYNSNTY